MHILICVCMYVQYFQVECFLGDGMPSPEDMKGSVDAGFRVYFGAFMVSIGFMGM